MAQRRMFSLKVIETDSFIGLPLSAQALYFHLAMRADDDGFVGNPRTIQRLVGASDDDIRLLLMKHFLLSFDSGVIVIKHWRINNYIKADRYTPTLYQAEKRQLYVMENGIYSFRPLLSPPYLEADSLPPFSPADTDADPDCLHTGPNREAQVSLGKDRSSAGQGEDSEAKIICFSGDGGTRAREAAESDVDEYLLDRQLDPTKYQGVSDDVISEIAALASAIFSQFTTREPTKTDINMVFFATYEQVRNAAGDYNVFFPKEKKQLLMYAFEQATGAGKPGDWKYIYGVLKKLSRRKIKTLDNAEDYDLGWNET